MVAHDGVANTDSVVRTLGRPLVRPLHLKALWRAHDHHVGPVLVPVNFDESAVMGLKEVVARSAVVSIMSDAADGEGLDSLALGVEHVTIFLARSCCRSHLIDRDDAVFLVVRDVVDTAQDQVSDHALDLSLQPSFHDALDESQSGLGLLAVLEVHVDPEGDAAEGFTAANAEWNDVVGRLRWAVLAAGQSLNVNRNQKPALTLVALSVDWPNLANVRTLQPIDGVEHATICARPLTEFSTISKSWFIQSGAFRRSRRGHATIVLTPSWLALD